MVGENQRPSNPCKNCPPIDKLVIGSFGDCKAISANLFELRMFFGPGYRVYYTIREREIIFLLAGGDKSTQSNDIQKATELLKNLEDVHAN